MRVLIYDSGGNLIKRIEGVSDRLDQTGLADVVESADLLRISSISRDLRVPHHGYIKRRNLHLSGEVGDSAVVKVTCY